MLVKSDDSDDKGGKEGLSANNMTIDYRGKILSVYLCKKRTTTSPPPSPLPSIAVQFMFNLQNK